MLSACEMEDQTSIMMLGGGSSSSSSSNTTFNITNNITNNITTNNYFNQSYVNSSVACADANSYLWNVTQKDGVLSGLCAADSEGISSVPYQSSAAGWFNTTINTSTNLSVFAPQFVMTSKLSGVSGLGVGGLLLVPNKTTVFNGLRVGGQAGSVFNGSQRLTINPIASVNKTEIFTVSIWFKRSSLLALDQQLFAQNYLNANSRCVINTNSGTTLAASCYNGSAYLQPKSITSLNDSIVNNVIWIYRAGSTAELYLNLINSTGTSSPATGSSSGFSIGSQADGTSRWLNGSIFKVVVWNRSLSAAEVASEYALGADTPTTNTNGLVLQYLLNKTPDVMETYSNSTHVKDIAYISTGEYYHKQYDVSGIQVRTIVTS